MRDVSRRVVLGVGATTVGLAAFGQAIPPSGATIAPAAAAAIPVRSQFTASVGGTFTATGPAGKFQLKLTKIADVAPVNAALRQHQFNLIFACVARTRVPDGIYTLTRSGVPTQSLFLATFGLGSPPQVQALVNRPA